MTLRSERFGAFILTHGRPDRVLTYDTLRKQGYTGPIWIVIDDEDEAEAAYRERFGDAVLTFSKSEYADRVDLGDNFGDLRGVIFARSAVFDLAAAEGCETFWMLDDDYTGFFYRFDSDRRYGPGWMVWSLDALVDEMVRYLAKIPALSIAFSQGGDHIGGGEGTWLRTICTKRKVMNTFFCRVDRRFEFLGRSNEDATAYAVLGHRGALFLSLMSVQVNQVQTQKEAGGMTDLYLAQGTYVKSFYSVMMAPSCVKVSKMGRYNHRLHHKIKWRYAAPLILSARHKKAA